MTVRYLIDTDWVSHYFNGQPEVVRRLGEFKDQGLGLSVVSLAELHEGIYRSAEPEERERELNAFLRGIVVIGIDEETCRVFGKERGRLRAGGRMVGDFDLLIGSTALRHSLTLLTNNRRHFEMIEGLRLVAP
ncbi:MAG: type II toxin-antitoxin system VapC family toxin [Candidatus Methylomirabilia bacterium]